MITIINHKHWSYTSCQLSWPRVGEHTTSEHRVNKQFRDVSWQIHWDIRNFTTLNTTSEMNVYIVAPWWYYNKWIDGTIDMIPPCQSTSYISSISKVQVQDQLRGLVITHVLLLQWCTLLRQRQVSIPLHANCCSATNRRWHHLLWYAFLFAKVCLSLGAS